MNEAVLCVAFPYVSCLNRTGTVTPVTPVVCSRNACGRRGGTIRLPPEKVANEIFSHCSRREIVASLLKLHGNFFLTLPLAVFAVYAVFTAVIMTSQDFASTVTLSDDQKTALIDLEPAFEHLLRDVGLDERDDPRTSSFQVKDRETFSGLADAPEEPRSIAPDLDIDLTAGGMPHKREFSDVLVALRRTKVQTEVKTNTKALQKQHSKPVRMLPESLVMVQWVKNEQEEDPPAQAYFEEFQEKLAAGDAPGGAA